MTSSTKTHIVLSLVAACLMLATPAASEPPADRSGPQQEPERRKEMLEKIRMVRMYSLTEALELDEATAAKLFPYLRKHDSSLEQLQNSKRKHHKTFKEAAKGIGMINAAMAPSMRKKKLIKKTSRNPDVKWQQILKR